MKNFNKFETKRWLWKLRSGNSKYPKLMHKNCNLSGENLVFDLRQQNNLAKPGLLLYFRSKNQYPNILLASGETKIRTDEKPPLFFTVRSVFQRLQVCFIMLYHCICSNAGYYTTNYQPDKKIQIVWYAQCPQGTFGTYSNNGGYRNYCRDDDVIISMVSF